MMNMGYIQAYSTWFVYFVQNWKRDLYIATSRYIITGLNRIESGFKDLLASEKITIFIEDIPYQINEVDCM